METFKKANSGKKITVFASVGALVASGIIGCGGKTSRQQDWIATDETDRETDRINKVSSERSTYQQKQISRIEASRSPKESGASSGNMRAGS